MSVRCRTAHLPAIVGKWHLGHGPEHDPHGFDYWEVLPKQGDYYLDAASLAENTIIVYTSDQGFFLGDHGWYDKRFMYEESLRMPLLVRFPQHVQAQATCEEMVTNVDFAHTFLDLAGLDAHGRMQGRSFTPLLRGESPGDWQDAVYYRYWQNLGVHRVRAHYGIRTKTHKLIYYYSQKLDPHSGVDEYRVPETPPTPPPG